MIHLREGLRLKISEVKFKFGNMFSFLGLLKKNNCYNRIKLGIDVFPISWPIQRKHKAEYLNRKL